MSLERRRDAGRSKTNCQWCSLFLTLAVSLAIPCQGNAAPPQLVRVTAGAPLEFGFVLSTSVVSTGTVVFSIKNLGRLRHRFEVCAVPGPVGPNSCAGKETSWLALAANAFLKVRFRKPGRYEYVRVREYRLLAATVMLGRIRCACLPADAAVSLAAPVVTP